MTIHLHYINYTYKHKICSVERKFAVYVRFEVLPFRIRGGGPILTDEYQRYRVHVALVVVFSKLT